MEPTWPKKRTSFHALLDFGWEGPVITLILAAATFLAPIFDAGPNVHADAVQIPVSTNETVPQIETKAAIITNTKARVAMIISCGLFAALAMASLAYKSHIKRTYNPTWEIHFEEEFDKDYMTAARSRAAGILMLYGKTKEWSTIDDTAEIEPVFDFFDNLRFLPLWKTNKRQAAPPRVLPLPADLLPRGIFVYPRKAKNRKIHMGIR